MTQCEIWSIKNVWIFDDLKKYIHTYVWFNFLTYIAGIKTTKILKGFNSKKSKNHKLQHWRSFLSYNNYSRNLLYVHLYLWPYKNGLANLKAQKFVWVSFEVKNQNFCLCYAVCCFVSKSDMMFSFDKKKL